MIDSYFELSSESPSTKKSCHLVETYFIWHKNDLWIYKIIKRFYCLLSKIILFCYYLWQNVNTLSLIWSTITVMFNETIKCCTLSTKVKMAILQLIILQYGPSELILKVTWYANSIISYWNVLHTKNKAFASREKPSDSKKFVDAWATVTFHTGQRVKCHSCLKNKSIYLNFLLLMLCKSKNPVLDRHVAKYKQFSTNVYRFAFWYNYFLLTVRHLLKNHSQSLVSRGVKIVEC